VCCIFLSVNRKLYHQSANGLALNTFVKCWKSKILLKSSFFNNNNNNDNIYGAVIVAKATVRAPGSCDEYGTVPSGRRPSDQAKRPRAVNPPVVGKGKRCRAPLEHRGLLISLT